eukprot:1108195-Rhodomonas_salina.1
MHGQRREWAPPMTMAESDSDSTAPKRKVAKKHQRDPAKVQLDEERARVAAELKKNLDMDGVMAINKPANWTSFDVVAKVRSELGKLLREADDTLTHKQYVRPAPVTFGILLLIQSPEQV